MEGFEMTAGRSVTAEMVTSRQTQEVQGQIIMAKKFPRDYVASCNRIMQACQRKGLAEKAMYEYPRGGQKVVGASIRLAEALAQNWGNMSFGIVELEQKNGESQVMAYAWDLETNTRQEKIFSVPHIRSTKKGNVPLTDPRDIYEMVANQGARRLRACILGIIPGDVVEDAIVQCNQTLLEGEKKPIIDLVKDMAAIFEKEFSVPLEAIEKYIGCKSSAFSMNDLVRLKRVYTSLKDGMAKREEIFELPGVEKSEALDAFDGKKKDEKPADGQQLEYAENDMSALNRRHDELIAKQKKTSDGYKKLGNIAKSALQSIGNVVKKSAIAPFKSLGNIAKNVFSKIGKSAKKSGGLLSTLGSRFKGLALSLLIFNQISKAFSSMISGIKQGFSNMYKEISSFRTSIDSLKAGSLTLKNSFAAAFRPLVEVALPYIQMAVDAMTELLNKIGQFAAVITGQKTYTKAVRQTTAAIEDENKAQNKQLSGLDKLNNLSSGSGTKSETSEKMFEENVPVSSSFGDIAKRLKDMWEDSDFSGLGATIGEKIKTALENIPWDSIKQTVTNAGKSLSTVIGGFAEVPGLASSIAKSIGEAINTGIAGVNSFLDSTNWISVGKFIGDGFNSIVSNIDFENIGNYFATQWNAIFAVVGEATREFDWSDFGLELSSGINTAITNFNWKENGAILGDLVKGILDTIITLLEETDWQELGNNIADFIGAIDWTGIFERLAEGVGAALGGLAAFLLGLIEGAWNSVVEWWNEVAFEDGKFTILGLLEGIWEGIKNIGTWIKEHIFKPFIDGFKKAFGIASPSKVMEEQGNFIMEGLLGGISSLVYKIISPFIKIKDRIIRTWRELKTKTDEIWFGIKNVIKTPINAILGFIESMANGIVKGINMAIRALNHLNFDVPDWLPIIGGETFGFNLSELSEISIPRLATGAVIPANKEFLAVLGDQKHGTNIEAPLSTIEEAVENALRRNGGAGTVKEITVKVPVEIDGNVLFELIKKLDLEQFRRTGNPSFQM